MRGWLRPLASVARLSRIGVVSALIAAASVGLAGCVASPPAPTVALTAARPNVVPAAKPTPHEVVASPATPTAGFAQPAVAASTSPERVVLVADTGDLVARAKTRSEYRFDYRMTQPESEPLVGRGYVKGNRFRQELTGAHSAALLDFSTRIAYALLADQQLAVRVDFAQALGDGERPLDRVLALAPEASPVGAELIAGQPATIYETAEDGMSARLWVSNEYGLLLRLEATTPGGAVTTEYSGYRFESQDDSLFELPPGTQIVDVPGALPPIPTKVAE